MESKEWPRRARVVAVYPGAHAVDVQFISNRAIDKRVPVMVGTASTNTGTADLPIPDGDRESGYTGLRDMTAIVDMVDGAPLVMGFVHERKSQMLFDDQERRIVRHASDVCTSVDKDGNVELYHPSGTFFRFGVTPEHEDLTGKNRDKNWAIERNTDKSVHANLEVWNGGQMKAKLHIDPSGNMVQELAGNLTQHVDGNVTQIVIGSVSFNAGGTIAFVSDTSISLSAPRIDWN